jgi:hypothetical protein
MSTTKAAADARSDISDLKRPRTKSQSHVLTQENRTSALQQSKPEDIIDITPAAAANQES